MTVGMVSSAGEKRRWRYSQRSDPVVEKSRHVIQSWSLTKSNKHQSFHIHTATHLDTCSGHTLIPTHALVR